MFLKFVYIISEVFVYYEYQPFCIGFFSVSPS